MDWTEPATFDNFHAALERTLRDAANRLSSNAALKPSEYSPTVLGLTFLRGVDVRCAAVKEEIPPQDGSWRKIGPTDFQAAGVVYSPDEVRFSHLLSLPESGNVGHAVCFVKADPNNSTAEITDHWGLVRSHGGFKHSMLAS